MNDVDERMGKEAAAGSTRLPEVTETEGSEASKNWSEMLALAALEWLKSKFVGLLCKSRNWKEKDSIWPATPPKIPAPMATVRDKRASLG